MSYDKMGGPAFPTMDDVRCDSERSYRTLDGMTLWDYYAGCILSNMVLGYYKPEDVFYRDRVLKLVSEYADAMLAERQKRFGGE